MLKVFEQMHGLRYLWFIGDGDSSVYHAVVTGVPSYGCFVQKIECANHAIKCYRNRLEALCKEHTEYRGRHGLFADKMKRESLMVLVVQLRCTALLEMLLLFITICGMVLGITLKIIDNVDRHSVSTQHTQVMYHIQ